MSVKISNYDQSSRIEDSPVENPASTQENPLDGNLPNFLRPGHTYTQSAPGMKIQAGDNATINIHISKNLQDCVIWKEEEISLNKEPEKGVSIEEEDLLETIIKYLRQKCRARENLKLSVEAMYNAFIKIGRLCLKNESTPIYFDQEIEYSIENKDKRNLILKCGWLNQQPQTKIFYEVNKCFSDFCRNLFIYRKYSSEKDLKDLELVFNLLKPNWCRVEIIENTKTILHTGSFSLEFPKNRHFVVSIVPVDEFYTRNFAYTLENFECKKGRFETGTLSPLQDDQISLLKSSCSFFTPEQDRLFDRLFPARNESLLRINDIFLYSLMEENGNDSILIKRHYKSFEIEDYTFDELAEKAQEDEDLFVNVSLSPSALQESLSKLSKLFSSLGVHFNFTESSTIELISQTFKSCSSELNDYNWLISFCFSSFRGDHSEIAEITPRMIIRRVQNRGVDDNVCRVILEETSSLSQIVKFKFGSNCFHDLRPCVVSSPKVKLLKKGNIVRSFNDQSIESSPLTKMLQEFCGGKIWSEIGESLSKFFNGQEVQPKILHFEHQKPETRTTERQKKTPIRIARLEMTFLLNKKCFKLLWKDCLNNLPPLSRIFEVNNFSKVPVDINKSFNLIMHQIEEVDSKTSYRLLKDICLYYRSPAPMPPWQERWKFVDVIERFRMSFECLSKRMKSLLQFPLMIEYLTTTTTLQITMSWKICPFQ